MKEKGFTLIELLAVIVILAIIALIAVPIILNIIEDARKESNERSVELYARAIKNGILTYEVRERHEVPKGKYKSSEDGKTLELESDSTKTFKVDYEGNVKCETTEIYENGNIYLEGCTVNNSTEKYDYGEKQEETSDDEIGGDTTTQVYKPQYYSWSSGYIEEDLPSDATENVSELDTKGYPFYLGLDVDSNNKVTAAYACFTRNGTEYCLKGNDTSEGVYSTNQDIIRDAFSDVLDACSFEGVSSNCDTDGLYAIASSNGFVDVYDDYAHCSVYSSGFFECF